MSFQIDLKKTLNKLPSKFPKGADMLKHFSKQLQGYEEQLKDMVSEFDAKSRDARQKSQAKLDGVLDQVKKTRTQLEKKVNKLVETERKRLNTNLNDFVTFLKSLNKKEKKQAPVKRKKTAVKKSPVAKKKTTSRRVSGSQRAPEANA